MKKKTGRPRIAQSKKRRSVTFMFSPDIAKKLFELENKNQIAEELFTKHFKGE